MFDVGGGPRIRGIWQHYYSEIHAVVFVVDITQRSRVAEAKEVLHATLKHQYVSKKPLLILANKQDSKEEDIMTLLQLHEALGIPELCQDGYIEGENLLIQPCVARSVKKLNASLALGLRWLLSSISNDEERFLALTKRVESETEQHREHERQEQKLRAERVRAQRAERERLENEKAMADAGALHGQPLAAEGESSMANTNAAPLPMTSSQPEPGMHALPETVHRGVIDAWDSPAPALRSSSSSNEPNQDVHVPSRLSTTVRVPTSLELLPAPASVSTSESIPAPSADATHAPISESAIEGAQLPASQAAIGAKTGRLPPIGLSSKDSATDIQSPEKKRKKAKKAKDDGAQGEGDGSEPKKHRKHHRRNKIAPEIPQEAPKSEMEESVA